MKKILIIKTSSLGDIIHTFPALSDAAKQMKDVIFDWVVEENFKSVPLWHPNVRRVIPVALRRWKKNIRETLKTGEWRNTLQSLRAEEYDFVLDAQGLIKSAVFAYAAKGLRIGLDRASLTEPLARFAYQKMVSVDLKQQAIFRMRLFFAQALDYPMPITQPAYGMNVARFEPVELPEVKYFIFLHGTTWPTKHWPEAYWVSLAHLLKDVAVLLPWSNAEEKGRAERIAEQAKNAIVLPKLSLNKIAYVISKAQGVISVDTGLGHLSAALDIPTIGIYGPTDPSRTGMWGRRQTMLASDFKCARCDKPTCTYKKQTTPTPACFSVLTPKRVKAALDLILK